MADENNPLGYGGSNEYDEAPSPLYGELRAEAKAWEARWPEAAAGNHNTEADMDALRGQLRVLGDEIARLRVMAMDDENLSAVGDGLGEFYHNTAHLFVVGALEAGGLQHLLQTHMGDLMGRRE